MEAIKSFKRILLATDGTAEADAAVQAAISLARYGPAQVFVLHVTSPRDGPEVEKLLEQTVDRLTAAAVMATTAAYGANSGRIAEVIGSAASNYKADLVVVGSRGLSDWQSIFQHSVSHQVLSLVDCPVLVVRGDADHNAIGKTRRIMIAVAGGDDVKPATDAAIAVAQAVNVEALVVHVTQALFGAQGFAYVESDEEIGECVDVAVKRLTDAGIPTEKTVIRRGPVARSLLEAAARWNADLIVAGSSRMGDVAGLMLGSVSHQLLHSADVPVLIAGRSRS